MERCPVLRPILQTTRIPLGRTTELRSHFSQPVRNQASTSRRSTARPEARRFWSKVPSGPYGTSLPTDAVWGAPIGGNGNPFPVVQSAFNEAGAKFSPDGKWIAYESDESGRLEIYVQSFMGAGNKWQVSTAGGSDVRWRSDGKELFFRSPNGQFVAVSIQLDPKIPAVQTGAPTLLFSLPAGLGYNGYGVTPDGQRFLIDTTIDPPLSPINLILNWKG